MRKKLLTLVLLIIGLIFFCLLFIGCKPCADKTPDNVEVVTDTVFVDLGYKQINDSLSLVVSKLIAENKKLTETAETCDKTNRKLARELLNERLVIENAKYYVNIVNRNRTQEKFLLGWMNRALNN